MRNNSDIVSIFYRFCLILNRIVSVGIIILFSVLIVSVLLQVFTRYVLNDSLNWTEEAARFAFVWCIMLGGTICTLYKQHAIVVIVRQRLPKIPQSLLSVLIQILMMICVAALAVFGWHMVGATARQLSPALRLPMSYIYLSVPLTALIHFLYMLCELLSLLFNFKHTAGKGGVS
jgi:TRAP-type C4-dicarboxylate transport system permease small subunit